MANLLEPSTLVVLLRRGNAVLSFLFFFFFFCEYLSNKAPFFPADWLT